MEEEKVVVGCGVVGAVVVFIVGPVGRHLWYDAALRQEASRGSRRVDLNVKRSAQQWEAEGDEKANRTIDPRGARDRTPCEKTNAIVRGNVG